MKRKFHMTILLGISFLFLIQHPMIAEKPDSSGLIMQMMGLRPDGSRQIFIKSGDKVYKSGFFNPARPKESDKKRTESGNDILLMAEDHWNEETLTWEVNLDWTGVPGPYTSLTSPDPSFQTGTTLGNCLAPTSYSYPQDESKDLECFTVLTNVCANQNVQDLGYDPIPNPTEPLFEDKGYWWDDEIDINCSYLNLIPSANLAHFWDRPVKAISATPDPAAPSRYANSATFRIPADCRSTYLTVESGGKKSMASSSIIKMIAPIPPPDFGHINGIVWTNSNGKIFVADQRNGEENNGKIFGLELFKIQPSVNEVASGLTKPLISRVSYMDGFVYVSSVSEAAPIMLHVVGCGTDLYTMKPEGILPAGIAFLPSEDACFIADSISGRVIRLSSDGSVDYNWGDLEGQWSFPFPCGMDADLQGWLNVGVLGNEGNTIVKIAPDGTWYDNMGSIDSTVPKAIECDRDVAGFNGTAPLIFGDQPFCEGFNREVIQNVSEGETKGPYAAYNLGANVWVDYDMKSIHVTPDWTYWIGPANPRSVVINNNETALPYISQDQTMDRYIPITVSGWDCRQVNVRVIDPPDLSPYAPEGGWPGTQQVLPYEGNDNKADEGDDFGLCEYAPCEDAVLEMNVTIGGCFSESKEESYDLSSKTIYLKVPARYSGNNYQVEVRKVGPGGVIVDKVPAISTVSTTWKRVMVERDKMFKRGGLLFDSFDFLTCGTEGYLPCNQIKVYDWSNVMVGDTKVVLDKWITYENGGETRTVTDISEPANGTKILTLDEPLTLVYYASSIDASSPPHPTFSNGESAGFGVITAGACDVLTNQINSPISCFYDADMSMIEKTYNDAFVEFYGLTDGMNAVPFLSCDWFDWATFTGIDWIPACRFSQLWFKNKKPTSPSYYNEAQNYFHLIGSSFMSGINGMSEPESDSIFVFRGTIENDCRSNWIQNIKCDLDSINKCTKETTLHEIAHQFRVNHLCNPSSNHHCANNAWCGNQGGCCVNSTRGFEWCINHPYIDDPRLYWDMRGDGITRMDCDDLASEHDECGLDDCSGGISVRTNTDPE